METKLTLKLKKNVIDRAKKYAHDRETSLSKIVENYLEAITSDNSSEIKISALVKSISGVVKLPDDYDHKEVYQQHLIDKYL
jgi:hypothetical protein